MDFLSMLCFVLNTSVRCSVRFRSIIYCAGFFFFIFQIFLGLRQIDMLSTSPSMILWIYHFSYYFWDCTKSSLYFWKEIWKKQKMTNIITDKKNINWLDVFKTVNGTEDKGVLDNLLLYCCSLYFVFFSPALSKILHDNKD